MWIAAPLTKIIVTNRRKSNTRIDPKPSYVREFVTHMIAERRVQGQILTSRRIVWHCPKKPSRFDLRIEALDRFDHTSERPVPMVPAVAVVPNVSRVDRSEI